LNGSGFAVNIFPCAPAAFFPLARLRERGREGVLLALPGNAGTTRHRLKQLLQAVNQIMTPPDPLKRPIGFIVHQDKKNNPGG
jgi:hypothetical protein